MHLFITFSLLLFPFCTFSQLLVDGRIKPQSKRQTHRLITKRGDSLLGTVMDWDTNTVSFKLRGANEIDLEMGAVDTIQLVPKYADNQFRNHPNFAGRFLFSPTAFTLSQGEWEYHNLLFLFNHVDHGFNDHLTVGLGGYFMPNLGRIGWVNFKGSFQLNKRFRMAIGGIFGSGMDVDGGNPLLNGYNANLRMGLGFLAFTWGNKSAYLNFCLFKGLTDYDGEAEASPWMGTVGGSLRVSQTVRIFAELGNLELDEEVGLSNIGISFLGKKSSTNFGFMLYKDFRGFPVFSYSRMIFTRK